MKIFGAISVRKSRVSCYLVLRESLAVRVPGPHASYPNTLSSIPVFWQVISDVSKYLSAFIFRATQFLGLWSWRQQYYDRPKRYRQLSCHSAQRHITQDPNIQQHRSDNLKSRVLFNSRDLCETKLWFIFPDDSITDRGRWSCDPCGGRFVRSEPEISVVSLLTALCRGTFTLKAVVGSQSVMQPRRFVLRTMIVLHSGWILHYSINL